MSQEFCEIRYVHVPVNHTIVSDKNRDGYTIAYSRNADVIYFVWVQKHKKDQYDRAIGRAISSEMLESVMAHVCDSPEIINNNFVNYLSVYKDRGFGCLTSQQLVSATINQDYDIKSYLADHIIQSLTCMDFKHKHISSILKNIVDVIIANTDVDSKEADEIIYDYVIESQW